MAGFRGLLYTLAKLMGDYNAVKKGKVGKRVGRRVAGKATGKAMRIWASYAILPTCVKGLNVTVRATGTIGTVFGILRGTLPDTKRQRGMLGLESDLRHHLLITI